MLPEPGLEKLASTYMNNAATEYFGAGQVGFSMFHKPAQREWNGLELVELPLVFRQELLGVIGVVFSSENEQKEMLPFLNIWSALIVTKLQLAPKEMVWVEAESVTLLHQILAVWKPEAYDKAMKAKELAQLFLKQLDCSPGDIELIGQASLLSGYELDVLSSWIGETTTVGLLREARRYMAGESHPGDIGKKSYGLIGTALSMVLWYGEHGDKELPSTLLFSLEEEPLKHVFVRLLTSRFGVVAEAQPPPESKGHFTPREAEVLNLVLNGLNNLEIAQKLFISTHTVKNHITKIYEKLDVNDRAQAIAKMYRTALTAPTQER